MNIKIRIIAFTIACSMVLSIQAQKVIEFLPKGKAKTAIIVCPGGSYCWLDKKTEGIDVAHWLNENGIAAYILY